ncbi:MAG: hypothetical protein NXY57DRAFT_1065153 [Lentinula lateritia]|nr:MAG: hypothetical protein NXY57DRAFT_1065153 [Lentinula lateritia]
MNSDSSIREDPSVPKYITLNMRYTLLTDLFLILIADSVYDSCRIVEAVNTGEGVGGTGGDTEGGLQKSEGAVADQVGRLRNWRITLLGLATLGGRLVIGLSAGLLAPVINVGLGSAFSTVGLIGISRFLAGSAGAAVIAARITAILRKFASTAPTRLRTYNQYHTGNEVFMSPYVQRNGMNSVELRMVDSSRDGGEFKGRNEVIEEELGSG